MASNTSEPTGVSQEEREAADELSRLGREMQKEEPPIMIILFHCAACGEDKPLQDMHSMSWVKDDDIVYQNICTEYGQTRARHLCRTCVEHEEEQ